MHLVKVMIADAQANTRVTQITLNIVAKNKKHSEKFLRLDQCINSYFDYKSLRSHLTSHNNKKLSKNKRKKTINQTDLDPITFCFLTSNERNSEKISPKQPDVRRKNTYVKILMDSGASASIIHESCVSKNNLITRKTSMNQWSTMAGSFSCSTSREAKITFKLSEFNVTAHSSTPFHVTTKKVITMSFLVEIYFGNQEFKSKIISQDGKISISL